MVTLVCILAFKFVDVNHQKITAWHCDDIGYVVPVNSSEFYKLSQNYYYDVLADKKKKYFFDVSVRK